MWYMWHSKTISKGKYIFRPICHIVTAKPFRAKPAHPSHPPSRDRIQPEREREILKYLVYIAMKVNYCLLDIKVTMFGSKMQRYLSNTLFIKHIQHHKWSKVIKCCNTCIYIYIYVNPWRSSISFIDKGMLVSYMSLPYLDQTNCHSCYWIVSVMYPDFYRKNNTYIWIYTHYFPIQPIGGKD